MMKYLVFSVLGILALGVVATIIMAPSQEVVEVQVVEKSQYEDSRTRMQEAVLVSGRDLREYSITATYILSSMSFKSDRRLCEAKIANLIKETARRNGSPKQILDAVTRSLNTFSEITKHDDTCRVREPYVSVAQTVGG
jgi:hypothetical protein